MEAFDLQDCAAELIVNRSDRLPYPVDHMLDLLVPNSMGPNLSYKQYMERFTADPKALFPSRVTGRTPNLPFVTGARRDLPLQYAQSFPNWNANLSSPTDGGLLVTTGHEKWAYAAILPLPARQGAGVLVVEVEVVDGQVGICVANADYTELAAEVLLNAKGSRSTIIVPVSEVAAGSVLMIRNGSRAAPSRAAISRVTLFAD
jgi:hypothetical protein